MESLINSIRELMRMSSDWIGMGFLTWLMYKKINK